MTWRNAHQYLKKVYLTTKNDSFREALSVALAALRGPTREQVEKVWRGRWQRGTKDWVCSRCGRSHTFVKSFCPNCGAPMTDEAAQMVMERLEALHEDNGCP